MKNKFPYECTVVETGRKFIPITIDYENRLVWWQQSQASDGGEWISFDDLRFKKLRDFDEPRETWDDNDMFHFSYWLGKSRKKRSTTIKAKSFEHACQKFFSKPPKTLKRVDPKVWCEGRNFMINKIL